MDKAQQTTMDDKAAAEAKLQEYFDRFNKNDVEGIIENVYATPLNIGLESGIRVLFMDADGVRDGLARLRGELETQDWVQSVIQNVNACVLTDGLVFADVTYQRQKAGNQPITPDVCIVYVLQNLVNKGWRITSFYVRDLDKDVISSA